MVPLDKKAHLLSGAAISGLGIILTGQPAAGVLLAAAAGAAKELWDFNGHGTPDLMDAVATVAGGAFVTGVSFVNISVP